jgi:3-oxoacyl-[acyl-carrier protein] reductase
MSESFAGKVIVVTGGAAGLGRAYAERFGAAGGHIVLADINAAGMAETQSLVEALGGSAECHTVDMSQEESIAAFAAKVLASHAKVDVLINNAGLHMGEIARGFWGLGMDKWQYFLAVAPHWRRPRG